MREMSKKVLTPSCDLQSLKSSCMANSIGSSSLLILLRLLYTQESDHVVRTLCMLCPNLGFCSRASHGATIAYIVQALLICVLYARIQKFLDPRQTVCLIVVEPCLAVGFIRLCPPKQNWTLMR